MDSRTEKNIKTLHVNAQAWARAHVQAILGSGLLPAGWTVKIISGNRTYAEQNALFAQGRSRPGPKVTNARGGQSNHNFGVAWDIGVFNSNGDYITDDEIYVKLADVGLNMGLDWGGKWKTFKDFPHYQVKTGLSTAQMREYVAERKPIPVPKYNPGATPNQPAPSQEVEVWDDLVETNVQAFLEGGRVWVAIRQFCDRFGGEVLSVGGHNFEIALDDKVFTVPGTIRGGAGYVKFADVNRVTEWAFTYSPGRLIIHTEEA